MHLLSEFALFLANAVNNLTIFCEQRERKMGQVDLLCYAYFLLKKPFYYFSSDGQKSTKQ